MAYSITDVTVCSIMNNNPVDGSMYYDNSESKIYMAFNGQWYKLEMLMTINEAIRIQKRKERKEKLIKINEG